MPRVYEVEGWQLTRFLKQAPEVGDLIVKDQSDRNHMMTAKIVIMLISFAATMIIGIAIAWLRLLVE